MANRGVPRRARGQPSKPWPARYSPSATVTGSRRSRGIALSRALGLHNRRRLRDGRPPLIVTDSASGRPRPARKLRSAHHRHLPRLRVATAVSLRGDGATRITTVPDSCPGPRSLGRHSSARSRPGVSHPPTPRRRGQLSAPGARPLPPRQGRFTDATIIYWRQDCCFTWQPLISPLLWPSNRTSPGDPPGAANHVLLLMLRGRV